MTHNLYIEGLDDLDNLDCSKFFEDVYNNIVESTENETIDKSKCSRCKSSEFIEDYTNGIVQINGLITSSYSNYINLYVKTRDSDVYAKNDRIILIDPTDVSLVVTEVKR